VKLLLIDNFDSFTFNIGNYLLRLGCSVEVVRNDQYKLLEKNFVSNFSKIILSPGPNEPTSAGCMMKFIELFHNKLPIFGICLGHQAIGKFFGGEIIKAKEPKHGKTSIITNNQSGLFYNLPKNIKVTRYHSLVIDEQKIPPEIEICATANDDGHIMAIKHKNLPIYGVQFHPESICSEYGLEIIKNFVNEPLTLHNI
jgi:anthranilate synthase/aminodeoxychorismate synthase-like glutamine amidotransferase